MKLNLTTFIKSTLASKMKSNSKIVKTCEKGAVAVASTLLKSGQVIALPTGKNINKCFC